MYCDNQLFNVKIVSQECTPYHPVSFGHKLIKSCEIKNNNTQSDRQSGVWSHAFRWKFIALRNTLRKYTFKLP